MSRSSIALFVSALSLAVASSPAVAAPDGAPVVRSVRVVGVDNADALRRDLATRAGAPLSRSAIAADIKRLWRLGVFDDVSVSTADGAVEFAVVSRPRLSRIEITGNRALDDKVVREALALRPGAPLSIASRARARERLRQRYADARYLLANVEFETRDAAEGSVDLVVRVSERQAVRVRRVAFVGNRAIDDRALRKASGIAQGALFPLIDSPARDAALELERQRIARRYLDDGFAEVAVDRPRLRLSADRRELWIDIPVREGPRYRLGALTLPAPIASEARLSVATGDIYDHSRLASAAAHLRFLFEERGHPFAVVTPRVAPRRSERVLDVSFVAEPGPRARVVAVEIRGNERTRDAVIRRELALAAGDRFTATAVTVSARRLQALGFFERVTPSVVPGPAAGEVVVVFELVERPTGAFMVGAGYSTVESFIANATIKQANLFGRGQSLELAMQLSGRRQDATIRFHDPHIGGTDWSAGAEAYSRQLEWPGFTRSATGGAVTLGRPLSERVGAQLTYRLEHASSEPRVGDVAASLGGPIAPTGLFGGGLTSSLSLAATYDDRDDRLRTARGTHAGASVELAPSWLGSERPFARAAAWARHAIDLGGGAGVHLRGDVGWITSLDGSGVPLALRFQAGGIRDVRGYAPGGLGPRLRVGGAGALTELALGGNVRLVTSAELVVPLLRSVGLSGVVFVDAGNVFNLEKRYCRAGGDDTCTSITDGAAILGGLRAAVGAGVRWRSPIGHLRFEWGVPLVRRPGDPRVRFHFGLL